MQGDRKVQFYAAVRGVPAYRIAQAFNLLTPGFSWTNCDRSLMAQHFAKGDADKVSVEILRATIDALPPIKRKPVRHD